MKKLILIILALTITQASYANINVDNGKNLCYNRFGS